jgi:hypothetical protein
VYFRLRGLSSYGQYRDFFSSLDDCTTRQIFIDDSSPLYVVGERIIDLLDGKIINIFYVPNLSSNFLSIFQITHYGNGKTVEFSPHDVVIRDIKDPSIPIASRHVLMILQGCTNLMSLNPHRLPLSSLLTLMTWKKFDMSSLVI